MLFYGLCALTENCISITLKFCERIKAEAWNSALRNRTLNCTWTLGSQVRPCFVHKLHLDDHVCLAKWHAVWCRYHWRSPEPRNRDVYGETKAINLWTNATLLQLYSFWDAVLNVVLGCVFEAATLGFCHTGLCSGLFCCENDLVAVRQLATVVIRTLKASELLWLCFRPYLWDHVGINIDYATVALLCDFFF